MLKFSIIVPIYNGEKYIRSTIENLLSSDYESIELILVIDGSTDNSKNISNEFKCDSRVKIIEKENGGIFSARNAGLYEATGEYVMFCDQDDILDVSFLSELSKCVVEYNNPNVLCFNARTFSDDKNDSNEFLSINMQNGFIFNQIQIREYLLYPLIHEIKDMGKDLMIENYTGQIWNCVYNCKFLKENNIYFEKCTEYEDDYLFSITCFAYASCVALVNYNLYYWRINPQSASHTPKYIENYFEKSINVCKAEERVLEVIDLPEKVVQEVMAKKRWYRIQKACENELSTLNNSSRDKQLANLRMIDLRGTRFKFVEGKKNKILWILLRLKLYTIVRIYGNYLLNYTR